jgi:urease accessory protein
LNDVVSDWLPRLLQTSDPLFPTGAYAHSLGLEEIVRLEVVRDAGTLGEFLKEQVAPALEGFDLPFLRFAWDAARVGDVDSLVSLDRELDAWKVCREQREASSAMGTRRLEMLRKIGGDPLLELFFARGTAKHHLVVCALQGKDMPLQAVLAACYYQSMAGMCSAALKLIRIGQEGCQRILQDVLADCAGVMERSLGVDRDNVGMFNPLLEIASMRHERAFERLFIS